MLTEWRVVVHPSASLQTILVKNSFTMVSLYKIPQLIWFFCSILEEEITSASEKIFRVRKKRFFNFRDQTLLTVDVQNIEMSWRRAEGRRRATGTQQHTSGELPQRQSHCQWRSDTVMWFSVFVARPHQAFITTETDQ